VLVSARHRLKGASISVQSFNNVDATDRDRETQQQLLFILVWGYELIYTRFYVSYLLTTTTQEQIF
jgi:hypothetical protein